MTPGFHQHISAADYHKDPCPAPSLSSSIANLLLTRSPRHAWHGHPRLNPGWRAGEVTSEMDIGTVAHMLLLEGHSRRVTIVDANDWRTNDAKAQRDAARAAGKAPILRAKFFAVKAMVDAAGPQLEQFEIDLPRQGKAEQCIVWQEGPIWCRALLDWTSHKHDAIVDYKSTDSAEPNSFARRLFQMGYDVQEAFYRRGMKALTGIDADFTFIPQEVDSPYLLSCVRLDRAAQALADRKVQTAIDIWTRCMTQNIWPGYPDTVCYAQAPGWAAQQWEEMEVQRTDLGGQA